MGVDLPLLTRREKTRLADALRDIYALSELFADTFIDGYGRY